MANSTIPAHRSSAQRDDFSADSFEEPAAGSPWLAVVTEKVKTMRYGVVQIVIHDSKVVQIERTERTRFDVLNPPAGADVFAPFRSIPHNFVAPHRFAGRLVPRHAGNPRHGAFQRHVGPTSGTEVTNQ